MRIYIQVHVHVCVHVGPTSCNTHVLCEIASEGQLIRTEYLARGKVSQSMYTCSMIMFLELQIYSYMYIVHVHCTCIYMYTHVQ